MGTRDFYLTQRLSRRNLSSAKGFDALFGCEYMGAAEFEWGALWPEARNGRCAMLRGQLETDFRELGDVLVAGGKGRKKGQECKVDVMLIDVYEGEKGGVVGWMGEWVESVRARGGKVRLVDEWPVFTNA